MIRFATLAVLLLLAGAAQAQRTVTGTVRDAATGEALPGANVALLAADGSVVGGTSTGDDGRFALRLDRAPADLAVRFIGYDTARLRITDATPDDVDIRLAEAAATVGEALVTAGQNPGTTLLRRVVARVRAQRAAVGPYAVSAYTRTTLFTPTGEIRGITEGASDAFWAPDTGWREIVGASRRTANLGAGRATPRGVAEGLQDLLAPDLEIFGHTLVGPASAQAPDVYDADLTSWSTLDGRTVATLSVRPKRATASAFVGTLQVLFDTADVLAVDLRPGPAFLFPPPLEVTGARYRQQYVPVVADSSLWLPADLRREAQIGVHVEGLLSADPFRFETVAQLSDYRPGVTAPDSMLTGAAIRRAPQPDSLRLAETGVALTPAETRAYAAGDSLGDVNDVFVFRGPLARFARGNIRIGTGSPDSTAVRPFFGFGVEPIAEVNPVERARVGAGLALRAGPLRLTSRAAFRTGDGGVTLGVDGSLALARAGGARISAVGSLFDGVGRRVAPEAPSVPLFGGRGGYYDARRAEAGLRVEAPRIGIVRSSAFVTNDALAFADVRFVAETARPIDDPLDPSVPVDADVLAFANPVTTHSVRAEAGIGTLEAPLGLLPRTALRVAAEVSPAGWDGPAFRRADGALDVRVTTFGRRRALPAALDVRLAGGVSGGTLPAFRQFAVEHVLSGPVSGIGGTVGAGVTAFGALRSRTDVPEAGDRYALVAAEHSFRTLPFEVLGLRSLVRRQYNLIVHGAAARTWGGPLAAAQWHTEAGVSLSGLLGGLRLDLTQRLDRPGTVFGLSIARVF